MAYVATVNHVNRLQTNYIGIIKILMFKKNKLMLLKFIIKIMLKYVLNVNKVNQLQNIIKIEQNQVNYKLVVNHVNLLLQNIIMIIINKLTLIHYLMIMILKHVINAINKNYILSFIKVQQNH